MKRVDHQSTKIIATVGPACKEYNQLLALVYAGVDVFRLNFSHGTHEEHREVIERIAYINDKYNFHIGIMCDLQGPKLRIGEVENGSVDLVTGDFVDFVTRNCTGNRERLQIHYSNFAKDVHPGERVLVDDGQIIMEVDEIIDNSTVRLKIIHGGPVASRKGVNLPDTKISLPSLTKKDKEDLDFMLKQPVHWIALSFVRSAKDVHRLQKYITAANHPAKIVAKIEKPEAVQEIRKIIRASNAIMIARGDLGVELPMEELPVIQKRIIHKCIQRARPVIVATQMMNSMISNPAPTRAEVTDVANAVFEGADAVMLSGETSVGQHPVKVVQAMNSIIEQAEKHYSMQGRRPDPSPNSRTFYSDVVCFNAAKTAEEIGAKAIVGMTSSGYTAFKISSYRPNTQIHIFSEKSYMLSTLNLVWGVQCFYYDKFTTTDETIHDVAQILKKTGHVKPGDVIVNTGSMPIHMRYRTNMLKVTIVE